MLGNKNANPIHIMVPAWPWLASTFSQGQSDKALDSAPTINT